MLVQIFENNTGPLGKDPIIGSVQMAPRPIIGSLANPVGRSLAGDPKEFIILH